MHEISLIGPEGDEIVLHFNDADQLQDLYLRKDSSLLAKLDCEFVSRRNPLFLHAANPMLAFEKIRQQGYAGIAEEEEYIETKKWPQ